MKKTIILICACQLFSSCASIFNHGNATTINSNPQGASVVISDKNQVVVYKGTTPATTTLNASDGFFQAAKYNVAVSKKGYPTRNVELRPDLSGWYFGNILLGGVIGMLIVDPATGAMYKMPEDYSVNLNSMATINDGRGHSIAIVDRSSVPVELNHKLIPVSLSR